MQSRKRSRLARSFALAVVCVALSSVACQTGQPTTIECNKNEWFERDGAMKLDYALSYEEAFTPDGDGNAKRGKRVAWRLQYLEEICHALPPYRKWWRRW